MTSEKMKAHLLLLARKTIAEKLGIRFNKKCDTPENEQLNKTGGVFVTLHKDGALRGCIGYIESPNKVIDNVKEMAISAAFGDPRFPKLAEKEFEQIDIEITILSPIKEVEGPSEVEVGKHGLVITKGFNRGLLLPQVPVEQGWDKDTFISHTCMKAGLMPDTWKTDKVKMEVFEGEVFGELDLR